MGPVMGRTNITVSGINLGKDYVDIKGGVKVAGVNCMVHPDHFESSQGFVWFVIPWIIDLQIIEKISLYMFTVKIFQRILLLFDYYWKSMPVLHMSNDCLSACKSFAVKELFILHNSCIFLIGCRMLSWKKTRYMHAWALNLLYSGWQSQWSSIPLMLNWKSLAFAWNDFRKKLILKSVECSWKHEWIGQ